MAKPKRKTNTVKIKRPLDPAKRALLQRIALNVGVILSVLGVGAAGMHYLRRYVDHGLVFYDHAPKVVLKNRPAWMSDFLADQIATTARPLGAHSTFDHQLLIDVTTALKVNPWIKNVRQVRRAFAERPGDTLEIDCDYRVPLALVHWKEYFWLVDGDGVKLPEQFTSAQLPLVMHDRDGRLQFRVIEGVQSPPVEAGRKWAGDDLAAGLTLAGYVADQPFSSEIARIDVSNFAGRNDPREAQLVLLTTRGTEIRWGRPINAKDFFVEVSVAQKLDYLRRVYEQYGQIDAKQPWIDVRFDKITYPSIEPTARLDPAR